MTLWRLHLKTAAKDTSHTSVIAACLDQGFAGIGWPVKEHPGQSADSYERIAKKVYKRRPPSVRFAKEMQENDLVWARDRASNYYLGRITGNWWYTDEKDGLDMPNRRPCQWVYMGSEIHTPGRIVAAFRGRCALQCIHDLEEHSQFLFNQAYQNTYPDAKPLQLSTSIKDFFQMISDADCEDVAAVYLQEKEGYVVYPSGGKRNTMNLEFFLRHRKTKTLAGLQVKQGKGELKASGYHHPDLDRVYLFSSEGKVTGAEGHAYFKELTPEKLFEFAQQYADLMMPRVQKFLATD